MLESGARNGSSTTALDRLGEVVAEALDSGVSEEELQTMVTTAVASYQTGLPGFPENDPSTVFVELPPGLIDVPTAARKYQLQTATIRHWLRKGRVRARGRLKGPAAGGGFWVMNEEELVAYISAPRLKGGRPRKRAHKT